MRPGGLTPWLGAAVVLLLVIVVASYRQTCHAYPNGGGAYAVSRENLGEDASLVAASALLIDYVLTVAVSVVAGVAAITSAAIPATRLETFISSGSRFGQRLLPLPCPTPAGEQGHRLMDAPAGGIVV